VETNKMNEKVKQEFGDMLELLTISYNDDLDNIDRIVQLTQTAALLVIAAKLERITNETLSISIDGNNV
jgi:hypothetical protein